MDLKKFTEIKAPVKYLSGEKFASLNINSKGRYLISTKGRLFSYTSDRLLKGGIRCGVRVMDYTPNNKNIPVAYSRKQGNMQPNKNGRLTITIQKLVALTFLKKPTQKAVVIHTNYDKLNNAVENLKWIDTTGQIKYARGSMRFPKHVGQKITHKEVLEIKTLLKQKRKGKISITIKQIADTYNIATMQVYRIQNGDLWSHVGEAIKEKEVPKKLKPAIVNRIRAFLAKGWTGRAIAAKFSITTTCVSRIKNKKYYR